MILPGFVGPSNTSRARSFDCEDTINLYLERRDAGSPKAEWALLGCPGMLPTYRLPAGPVRALFYQDGRCFAIGGTAFCELFPNRTYIVRGTVALDAYPATISSNGSNGFQVFVTSGGYGYIFDLEDNTFVAITDDGFPFPVVMGGFIASSFVALKRASNTFQYSDLNDGLVWDALNVAQTSLTADHKTALAINHGELWLYGTQRSEIWVPQAGGTDPFAPLSGTIIEHGIIAPWSAQRLDNTLLWVGGDERGDNIVFRANGYTPQRVSTFAVETYLNQLPTTANAIGWTYQEEGHAFYLLYLPAADETLCYDVSTDSWHKRAIWDTDLIRWRPHLGRCHAFAFGKHLVGDRTSGTVYQMRLDYYFDGVID